MKAKKKKECEHDYDHPVRKGRSDYRCPKCGDCVTLASVLLHELGFLDKPKDLKKKNIKL
jgi:tRNA(Ile2) C34 agmatinyltransferase TiaS